MKACFIQLITLSCMEGFQNDMASCCVACKDHVAILKVKVTIQTYAMYIGYDENTFVSYRFDCKINVSLLTDLVPLLSLLYSSLPL